MTEDFFYKISDVIRNNNNGQYHEKMNKIKKQYPQAYEKWTFHEEIRLKRLFAMKKAFLKLLKFSKDSLLLLNHG